MLNSTLPLTPECLSHEHNTYQGSRFTDITDDPTDNADAGLPAATGPTMDVDFFMAQHSALQAKRKDATTTSNGDNVPEDGLETPTTPSEPNAYQTGYFTDITNDLDDNNDDIPENPPLFMFSSISGITREIQIFYDGGNSHCLFKTGVPA